MWPENSNVMAYSVAKSPKEVLDHLSTLVDGYDSLLNLAFGTKPCTGVIGRNSFELKLRDTGGSWKPVLFGRVTPTSGGSLVQLRIGMDRSTPVFMMVWLGGVALFQLATFLAWLSDSADTPFRGWLVLAPSGMFIGGLLVYRFGKMLGESQANQVRTFAEQVWGAQTLPGRASDSQNDPAGGH